MWDRYSRIILFPGKFPNLGRHSISPSGWSRRIFPGSSKTFRSFTHKSRGNKGWFHARAVLANVPSFRFLGSRNIKNHSFLLLDSHCRERLLGGNSGTRGTSAKSTLLEPPLCEPRSKESGTATAFISFSLRDCVHACYRESARACLQQAQLQFTCLCKPYEQWHFLQTRQKQKCATFV